MSTSSNGDRAEEQQRVVINFENELVKGYLESHSSNTIEELLRSAPGRPPSVIRLRREGSDTYEEISTLNAKAIFYVKSFDGDPRRKDLKFHTRARIVHGIWIRIEFLDSEVMEGIVSNTVEYLIAPGFFLRPTDPGSNNKLVYVMKSQLKDCRVLGLRNLYEPAPES